MVFGKGVSNDEEPDIWLKALDDQIRHWIDLGQPDEKRLRQSCGKSARVDIYCYQFRSAQVWWNALEKKTENLSKLSVSFLKLKSIVDFDLFQSTRILNNN